MFARVVSKVDVVDCGENVGGGATNPDDEVRYDASDTLVPGTCEITTLVIR